MAKKPTTITREQWLLKAAAKMRPLIKKAAGEYKDVLVSVGFAKGRANAIGQCWSPQQEAHMHQVFICPRLVDTHTVLATLAHELVHAAVGCECGHKGPFKKVARALGLEGKLTATVVPPDSEFGKVLKSIGDALGPYPHQRLMPKPKGVAGLDGRLDTAPVNQRRSVPRADQPQADRPARHAARPVGRTHGAGQWLVIATATCVARVRRRRSC